MTPLHYKPGSLFTLPDGRLTSIVRIEHLQSRGMGLLFTYRLTVVTGNSKQFQLFR